MKRIIRLGLLVAALLMCLPGYAAVPYYDAAAAKAKAQADFGNWMSYLPDDVFVAHVSIPGTHDTATAENWASDLASSTGKSTSTTQEKSISEQLAGGVRAFDFRPGLYNNELWCNHGVARTTLKLADAFTTLKNYLAAHPGEFFVMHLFRGNVYQSGAPILGGTDKAADKEKYNQLFNEMFNQGQFADMFVEYSPYLKVKDVRGKIIVFRRDRIDFAHVSKAGNLWNWPGDADLWNENSKVSVELDSDPTVRGIIRATDVSSPDNAEQLDIELNSIQGLFEWQCNQTLPNDAKRNGSYKPDWSMIFTSGAYKNENSNGYRENATYTNPHLTNLIKTAKNNGKPGPTGIVFSDWVLTDNNSGYATMGVELVPTIAYNNFDYIQNYILDDQLFSASNEAAESFWDSNKQYFMRNVGTGNYLSVGEWWGTHATTAAYGLKVKVVMDKNSGTYTINTTLNNGGFGSNAYLDNSSPMDFDVTYVGNNKYVFCGTFEDGQYKALAATGTVGGGFAYDGTTHNVDGDAKNISDPYQQWEVIDIDELYEKQLSLAAISNPQDITYKLPGARFFGNDSENKAPYWNFSSSKASMDNPGVGDSDCRRLLRIYNVKKSGWTWDAKWTLSCEVTGLPEGIYSLKWKAYRSNISDQKMSINGVDVTNQLQAGSVSPKNETSLSMDMGTIGNELRDEKFTCKLENIVISNGKLTINASAPTHSSATAFLLDDFELVYLGPAYQQNYPELAGAIGDAKLHLEKLGKLGAINFTEYENGMKNQIYNKETEREAALKVYEALRKVAFSQTAEVNTDYTAAIYNPSFETSSFLGWNIMSNNGDTDAKPNSNGTYTVNNIDRFYLFNTWDGGTGTVLYQTIPNLPAGRYEISALAANDENNYVFFEVKGDTTITGQRSQAFRLKNGNGVGERVSFVFDVAEGTPDITIYFVGGNVDGTWNDTGGAWYKVDDFRLIRLDDADHCIFYNRLQTAINDANRVVTQTLKSTPYYDEWNVQDYQDLIDAHIASGHVEDPLGDDEYSSNGAEEVNEVYNRLRYLVLSQHKNGADMTGAISNHSFEMGDLTGWTCVANTGADVQVVANSNSRYTAAGCDGSYLFNSWENGDQGFAIYQTIPNMSAGKYRLEVLLASGNDKTVRLGANGSYSEPITIVTGKGSDDEAKKQFYKYSFEFVVAEDGTDVTLGVYPNIPDDAHPNGEGDWYKADDFELFLVDRHMTIDWTMEAPSHGTIILPFDVPASELADKGLEIYTLKTSGASKTPADPEVNSYHLLTYENVTSGGIKAFTPYVVKNVAAAKTSAPRKATASDPELREYTGDTYTFTGTTSAENYKTKAPINNGVASIDGLLIGTLIDHPVTSQEHHLNVNTDDEYTNVGFVSHDDAAEAPNYETSEVIPAYHAYMVNPVTVKMSDGTNRIVTEFYFGEPTLPVKWSMEGEHYGTLILPFRAKIPAEFADENLKVYRITELDGPHGYNDPETGEELFKYSVMKRQEVEGYIEANTPYIVMTPFEDLEAPAPAHLRRKAAPASETAGEGFSNDFYGKATNSDATYTAEVLTGVLKTTQVDNQHYSLYQNGETGHFQRGPEPEVEQPGEEGAPAAVAETADNSTTLPAYHAYINSAQNPNQDFLFFAAPNDEQVSGIEDILAANSNVDVYDLSGVLLRSDVPMSEALDGLSAGIYILQCGDTTLKVIK